MNQHTLKNTYSFEGKGLHTGKYTRMRLCPAPVDTGVVFIRTDLGGKRIPATADNVRSTRRSTLLGKGRAEVGTVEHLLSALTGLGIDNVLVEVDNREVPILDGSASKFVDAIAADGLLEQDAPRKWVEIPHEIIVRNSKTGAWVKVAPAANISVELTIDFKQSFPGKQTVTFSPEDDYASQIAPCRTFCFLSEVWMLTVLGLAQGGDLGNAIVIADKPVSGLLRRVLSRRFGKKNLEVRSEGYLSNVELHFPDECARHKLLDIIGDLRLCGGFPRVRIEAYKAGHTLNTAAAKEVFKIKK